MFTDQELDSETGLYNYDARLYDPSIGMFISPDGIVPDMYNPQSLNRYAYCLNNPLKYIDPSGHEWIINSRGEPHYAYYSEETPELNSGWSQAYKSYYGSDPSNGSIIALTRTDGGYLAATIGGHTYDKNGIVSESVGNSFDLVGETANLIASYGAVVAAPYAMAKATEATASATTAISNATTTVANTMTYEYMYVNGIPKAIDFIGSTSPGTTPAMTSIYGGLGALFADKYIDWGEVGSFMEKTGDSFYETYHKQWLFPDWRSNSLDPYYTPQSEELFWTSPE